MSGVDSGVVWRRLTAICSCCCCNLEQWACATFRCCTLTLHVCVAVLPLCRCCLCSLLASSASITLPTTAPAPPQQQQAAVTTIMLHQAPQPFRPGVRFMLRIAGLNPTSRPLVTPLTHSLGPAAAGQGASVLPLLLAAVMAVAVGGCCRVCRMLLCRFGWSVSCKLCC